MNSLNIAKGIVKSCLQLGERVNQFDEHTQLMGALPEFNSLTITTMVAEIETELDCTIEDYELSAEIFETLGSLAAFIDSKMN
jgi:acyl carrier protein